MADPRLPDDSPATDRPTFGLPDDPAPVAAAPPPPAPPRVAPPPPLRADGETIPEARQLPPHQGKLARIGGHVSSLSNDLKEWVELRIELVKAEVRETVEQVKASLKRKAIGIGFLVVAGVLALYALGFLFGALAWGLAALVGSAWLGMLLTALLLFVVVGVLAWLGKRKLDEDQAIEARARVSKIQEDDQIHPTPPSTREIQDLEREKARAAAV